MEWLTSLAGNLLSKKVLYWSAGIAIAALVAWGGYGHFYGKLRDVQLLAETSRADAATTQQLKLLTAHALYAAKSDKIIRELTRREEARGHREQVIQEKFFDIDSTPADQDPLLDPNLIRDLDWLYKQFGPQANRDTGTADNPS